VLRRLNGRIWHVQVKDAVRRGGPGEDDWQLVPLGYGEVPVEEVLSMLPEVGYQGWVSLEFEKRWHPELAPPEHALPAQSATLRKWAQARP
jgi:sugar phosphate isomerase/epimerase